MSFGSQISKGYIDLTNSKKPSSGFVPIPFKLLGNILFPISIIMVVMGGLDYLAGWDIIPRAVLFVGLGLLILSSYLRYVVPKE